MSQKSKRFRFITGSVLTLALVTAGGASAYAATNTGLEAHPMNSLVTAIATRFNLNTADVQKVFDDNRTVMQTQMKAVHTAKEAERLSTAVTAGKLTQAQADLIIAKRLELETTREAQRSAGSTLTDAERKSVMQKEREALKAWMTANNIPQQYMMMGHGGKGPRGDRPKDTITN